ncbi:MAG TPA: integration host factor subunit alpha [Oligoflexia bacterium]|nr:integration host factor subunit alpha [Oligoflexia bacterium]HMR23934.1 integration host factor subunit alpha [Oligoflexia bacterium]
MAFTKATIVEEICEKIGLPKKDATDVVEFLFDTMKNCLIDGESLKISGFGSFLVRNKKARLGRNPQTGEAMEISARRVVTFKTSQVLRDILDDEEPSDQPYGYDEFADEDE